MIAIPNTVCIVGAFMGIFGLKASLVLNNGFNLIAAANGMLPYTETSAKNAENKIEAIEPKEVSDDERTKKEENKDELLQKVKMKQTFSSLLDNQDQKHTHH